MLKGSHPRDDELAALRQSKISVNLFSPVDIGYYISTLLTFIHIALIFRLVVLVMLRKLWLDWMDISERFDARKRRSIACN